MQPRPPPRHAPFPCPVLPSLASPQERLSARGAPASKTDELFLQLGHTMRRKAALAARRKAQKAAQALQQAQQQDGESPGRTALVYWRYTA